MTFLEWHVLVSSILLLLAGFALGKNWTAKKLRGWVTPGILAVLAIAALVGIPRLQELQSISAAYCNIMSSQLEHLHDFIADYRATNGRLPDNWQELRAFDESRFAQIDKEGMCQLERDVVLVHGLTCRGRKVWAFTWPGLLYKNDFVVVCENGCDYVKTGDERLVPEDVHK